MKFVVRLLFGFRTYNEASLQTEGPVLLIPNHTSWFDWLFLIACLGRSWKFVTSSATAQASPIHRLLMVNRYTFPIDPASPYAVKRMAEYLQAGGKLVLFAEGRLSRTGTLMKLFDGTGFLLFKTGAKVITCYLKGARHLPFSPNHSPKQLLPRLAAHFSEVLIPPTLEGLSTSQLRKKYTSWLRDRMVQQQFDVEMQFGPKDLLSAILSTASERPGRTILADASGRSFSYRKLVMGSEILARLLSPVLRSGSSRVGVLLPNVSSTPLTLMACWQLGKIPAVLNFSTGNATMLACIQLAGLKQIVTSRLFLERARLDPRPFVNAGIEIIYLEDLRKSLSVGTKIAAVVRGYLAMRNAPSISPDETAVVLFTSGSEGVPKGVQLSHTNILANIRQMLAVTDLQDTDRVFTCLPLFHSFGLTVGTLLPLVRGMFVFVYPSPLHYRLIPTVFYDYDCTVFLSTNTFLNGYARKAHPYDFRSMRYLFAAAEKLQETTATTWSQRFGVRILEGYGATECAPCISVNTPLDPKHGTVGRVMPGMELKLEPVEGVEEGGRLFVRGPNVMQGYLNPEANQHFKALNGWYDTGDIVSVDSDGFVSIRGRMKRFAKVSGEMVSLTAVEDALAGAFPQFGLRCQIAVVTRPDEDKGEALIAVSNEPRLTLDEIRAVLKGKGLTNLCVPREIRHLREIPKLGTGKVNHRELQRLIMA